MSVRCCRLLFLNSQILPVLLLAASGFADEKSAAVVVADTELQVHDSRLQLDLIAADPQLVTPIGLAIDESNRLFVLESHTHDRPTDYDGPAADRVLLFGEADNVSPAEPAQVFADGIQTGLNLAVSPSGVLYVVCAREVLALPDADGDGRCDSIRTVLTLQTQEGYSHNCLLGITFDRDGWMYVSRGNTGSRAYSLTGPDGSRVRGYGDGGSIIRCRPDGSQLQEFATGFWNPFSLKFDHAGRLLCVDNDPDARGPNRLVHVVHGGDYGYRSLYGGSGNHPFQAWNGELPGTLPFISGTGEAPCDLLDCRRTSLPRDYADSQLVTVWNENTIERHELAPRGISLQGTRSVLVSGGDDFRPVALAADRHGNVFFTDWMLVSYPNHGHGRLWKLSAKPDASRMVPRPEFAEPVVPAVALPTLALTNQSSWSDLRQALLSDDPFQRHQAVMVLSQPQHQALSRQHREDDEAEVRLGCLLALQRSDVEADEAHALVREFLTDPDQQVRHAAIVWAGRGLLTSLRPELELAISGSNISPVLFEAWLAALTTLQPEFADAVRQQSRSKSSSIPRQIDESVIADLVTDSQQPIPLRILAIRHLQPPLDSNITGQLIQLSRNAAVELQLAAIRQLALTRSTSANPLLLRLAEDPDQPSQVRCEALLALSLIPGTDPVDIQPLLQDADLAVAVEAARTLSQLPVNPATLTAAAAIRDELPGDNDRLRLAEQLNLLLHPQSVVRPVTLPQWQQTLAAGGDPQAGRRVFYSAQATCANCHTTSGLGGTLGPELSHVGQSLNRDQIVQAVLRPSDSFPPQYQAWLVVTTDGKVHTGLQLDHKSGGAIELFTTAGKTQRFEAADIDDYQVSQKSLMPDGLEHSLTVSELRDLVAWLESLK